MPSLAACRTGTYNRAMDDIRSMLDEGLKLHRGGQPAAAEGLYRQVLQLDPENGEAHHLIGVLRFQAGLPEEAVASFEKAVQAGEDDPRIPANLGAALLVMGRVDEAIEKLERAANIAPETPQVLVNLGMAYRRANRAEDSADVCARAVSLFPDDSSVHGNLAIALLPLGRAEDARTAAETAVSLSPQDADHLNTLGSAFLACHRTDDAVATFRRAADIAPDRLEPARNLALCLQESKLYEQAATQYDSVISRWPLDAAAYAGLARTRRLQGFLDDAIEVGRRAVALNPESATHHSNLLFSLIGSPDLDGPALRIEHEAWAGKFAAAIPERNYLNGRDMDRTLRVGLVSADFRDHPVGRIVEPVLKALDPDSVRITCYSNAVEFDDLGERLAASHQFVAIAGLSDEVAAQRLLEDEIDILVDLAGHTARHRLGVFALRPAPVQASWLGYMSTTGLSTIDYVIGDAVHTPAAFDGHFTEQVWRLPRDLACLPAPDPAPPVVPPPSVASGRIVYGSFNNPGKVTDRAVSVWARILGETADSVLVMRYAGREDRAVQTEFSERFRVCGIEPSRLVFEGSTSYGEVLDAYNRIDIALDTFPYSGTMTTMEALWMGVPVVALAGDRMVARQAAAHLTAAGLKELVGRNEDEYFRIALDLAGDTERLAFLRAGMRERLSTSELMDAGGLARALEDAWRGMWRLWCEGAR